jgi:hypothetical protein
VPLDVLQVAVVLLSLEFEGLRSKAQAACHREEEQRLAEHWQTATESQCMVVDLAPYEAVIPDQLHTGSAQAVAKAAEGPWGTDMEV